MLENRCHNHMEPPYHPVLKGYISALLYSTDSKGKMADIWLQSLSHLPLLICPTAYCPQNIGSPTHFLIYGKRENLAQV